MVMDKSKFQNSNLPAHIRGVISFHPRSPFIQENQGFGYKSRS
jgi:hypothetical protein